MWVGLATHSTGAFVDGPGHTLHKLRLSTIRQHGDVSTYRQKAKCFVFLVLRAQRGGHGAAAQRGGRVTAGAECGVAYHCFGHLSFAQSTI